MSCINSIKSHELNRTQGQSSWYTLALEYWIANTDLKDYKILPFKFLVESTIKQGEPKVFTVTPGLLRIGRYGRTPLYTPSTHYVNKLDEPGGIESYVGRSRYIKGFEDLLLEYRYYMNAGWEMEREYLEREAHYELDWLGII